MIENSISLVNCSESLPCFDLVSFRFRFGSNYVVFVFAIVFITQFDKPIPEPVLMGKSI